MQRLSPFTFFFAALVSVNLVQANESGPPRQVVGWAEPVLLSDQAIGMQAKLDTGARNSSLNGRNIEYFTFNGHDMVRFEVEPRQGEIRVLELPLARYARIRRHFGKSQIRPVVMLSVCLSNLRRTVEVNLVDRDGFDFPMLLGRTFLAPDFLIDSSRTYTTRPICNVAENVGVGSPVKD